MKLACVYNLIRSILINPNRYEFDLNKLIDPYKSIAESPHLQGLENLIIRDSRVIVTWKSIQLMTPERFPNLKYLDIPINAIYDYDSSENVQVQQFPDLHIKYSQ